MWSIVEWIQSNPAVVVVVALLVYRMVSSSRPFPEAGGCVKSIHSGSEFDAELAKGIVVADFYATWCPPCRTAAPIYGALSNEFDATFLKVDVDECRDLARREGISAMPSFKFYEDAKCVRSLQGFQQTALIKALDDLGVPRKQKAS
ncbi:hypothetical protein CTAYLR_007285 [Chrysophaeum taylorii]|uniref:Thioredoxin domain-containing protein n=1 Tax=Chrysophaeum taylorii TaxID=2483200 RepID=A0AAD7XL10_9STRA|nr:hypothetical protein CTAYLR_007285 [Chrysophaeum taylorii]